MMRSTAARLSVQSLRIFLAILEYGSLSAAGRALSMTQPAVLNHLHALEERFGVKLLTRGRRLKPTPAGESLAEHARQVLEDLMVLEAEMAKHAEPRGRLVIGASSTPGDLLMPRLAVELSERHPDVALDIHIADTEETITALLNHDVEVAVVGGEVEDSRLSDTIIGQDELVAVVAANDPLTEDEVTPEDLAVRPFVMRERGSATRQTAEDALVTAGVEPRVTMELGSNAAVVGAVAAGAGVGGGPLVVVGGQPPVSPLGITRLT